MGKFISLCQKTGKMIPKPNSLWLVVVECRYNVVRVSPQGDGFFIPGQEPCWRLDHVTEWVREIVPPSEENKSKGE